MSRAIELSYWIERTSEGFIGFGEYESTWRDEIALVTEPMPSYAEAMDELRSLARARQGMLVWFDSERDTRYRSDSSD